MKLKYKKIIVVITMSTMCIGFITFSLLTPSGSNPTNRKENKVESVVSGTVDKKNDPTPTLLPSAQPEEVAAEPNELELKEDTYPKINALVEKYFEASVNCDMKELGKLVSNITHIDEDVLRAKYEYVEGFQNIQCYTIDGLEEGTYRVYVCSDMKLSNIDTLAPGLSGLYITTNEQGDLVICLDELDASIQEFMDKADNSAAVKDLNSTITAKFDEAKANDVDLNEFCEKLENAAATPTPEETEAETEPTTKVE